MSCRVHRFANGLKLATVEMPYMHTASFGVWVGVGGRHERVGESGVAHFLEHMLFKGTARRSARAIVAEVERVGGNLNAFTSDDHTCFYAKADAGALPRIADVVMDLYAGATLPEGEVGLEREVIREEIRMYAEQPSTRAEDLLGTALWPGHPAGRPLTGTLESVAGIGVGELRDFRRRHHVASGTVVAVAGRVSHDALAVLLEPMSEAVPSGRGRAARKLPGTVPPRLVFEVTSGSQSQLALGFRAFGRNDPRRAALKLLGILLGGNMSSRLFQKLRERHGLCYSVQAEADFLEEAGALNIYLGTEGASLRRALEILLGELDRVCREPPSKRELKAAREFVVGSGRMERESTNGQMFYAGESLLAYRRYVEPHELERELAEVEPEDICEVAGEVLRPSSMGVALVGGADAEGICRGVLEK